MHDIEKLEFLREMQDKAKKHFDSKLDLSEVKLLERHPNLDRAAEQKVNPSPGRVGYVMPDALNKRYTP